MADKQVTYEVRIDSSKADKELEQVEKKIETGFSNSSKKAGKAVEDNIGSSLSNVEKKTEAATGKTNKSISSIGNVASSARKMVTSNFASIGTAAISVGEKAISAASDLDAAINQFAVSTGTGKDELSGYEQTLKNIYASNYGESFTDIANTMASVKRQMGDLDQTGLQNITESAFLLRDTFGYDVNESVRAAATMMQQFGIDGDKAMSLIAAGAQSGLDYSGDLLANITEYSAQFAKVGLDADDMFQIMQTGAETGAFNLEQVGSAIQEMSSRVADGSIAAQQGFEQIGLNADEMSAKFAAGGESAKEAFNQTIDALASMEDPIQQNAAGVEIFGSQWENLGPEVVAQLANIEEGAYATAEQLEGMKDIQYDDMGSMLESLNRQLELLLVPLGEALIPFLEQIISFILPMMNEVLAPIIEQLSEMIGTVLPPLMDLFMALLEPLTNLISMILPTLTTLLGTIIPLFTEILNAILPPLLSIIQALLEPLMNLINTILPPLINLFQSILIPLLNMLMPIIETLANIFSSVLGGAINAIMPIIQGVISVFQGIIDFITGIFTGNWEQAWNGIVNAFKSIINLIPGFFELVINAIIGIINGITGALSSIWSWTGLPSIPKIPNVTLPRFKAGIDFVPNDFFPALLDAGERVLTREENAKFNALGGLTGLEQTVTRQLAYNVGVNSAPINIMVESPVSLDGKVISKNSTKHQYINTAVKRYK